MEAGFEVAHPPHLTTPPLIQFQEVSLAWVEISLWKFVQTGREEFVSLTPSMVVSWCAGFQICSRIISIISPHIVCLDFNIKPGTQQFKTYKKEAGLK